MAWPGTMIGLSLILVSLEFVGRCGQEGTVAEEQIFGGIDPDSRTRSTMTRRP
jgi:hypothetical protein